MPYQLQTENVILDYNIHKSNKNVKYLGTGLTQVCKIFMDIIMTFLKVFKYVNKQIYYNYGLEYLVL